MSTATQPDLSPFEGLPVVEVGAEVPGLAGGLRDAVSIAPVESHQGEIVYLLVKATTLKVRHEPVNEKNPAGAQRRVHVYRSETVTFVDEAVAAEHIAAMEQRLRDRDLAKYAEKNELTIEQAILQQAHEDGEHDDKLDELCPKCEKERQAEQGEEPPA